MRRCLIGVLGLALAAGFPSLLAAACETGARPGSTLLFPYFEVDTEHADGITTLLAVSNESTAAVLTRVVIWADWAKPVWSFDMILKPKGVQTINMRDVLNGNLPNTAGPEVLQFTGCTSDPPAYGGQVSKFAIPSCTDEYDDVHSRGYVTVDTTNHCYGLTAGYYEDDTPADLDYYTGLTVNNVLWGDMMLVNPKENSAQGVEAVAIRAESFVTTRNTFYGRYVGWDGRDKRSQLPARWSTRYLNGGAFDGGTDLIVFRNTDTRTYAESCFPGKPRWYPLMAEEVTVRDESGKSMQRYGSNGLFPLATQRVHVADLTNPPLQVPFGRIDLSLYSPDAGPSGAWVIPIMSASGRFSVGLNAQPMDNGCP